MAVHFAPDGLRQVSDECVAAPKEFMLTAHFLSGTVWVKMSDAVWGCP